MFLPAHIALLELKRYLMNRGELAFSIALPIVLFALMYGAFGGEASFHATVNVVDLDGGVHARALVDRLDSLDQVTLRERSLADADAALERSAILSAVVIPAGFSAALDERAASGVVTWDTLAPTETPTGPGAGTSSIGLMADPAIITIKQRGNGGQDGQAAVATARAVAQEIAEEAQTRYAVHMALEGSGIAPDRIDAAVSGRLAEERANPSVGVVTRVAGGDGDGDEAGTYSVERMVPGMMVMFLMFALSMGAQTLVEERQNRTLERLMTTRLSVNGLFAGKFLAGVLRATTQAGILLALAFLALQIGGATEFAQSLAFSVLVAATVSALGLAIGSVARTRDQAIWSAVVITMFMTVFGGTFFDVSGNGALDALSRITLTRYAIEAMFGILSGGESLVEQWLGAAVMAGSAVALLVVARVMFRIAGGGR